MEGRGQNRNLEVKIGGDLGCNFIQAAGQADRQTAIHQTRGAPRPNPYSFKDNSWDFSTVWVFCGRFGDSRSFCLGKFVNSPNVIPWT